MQDWCLEVWGDYACFTRPEMKVERVSYDVMTPSAARGIFESILWKPAIKWNITKIEVINPIIWTSVRRNEVGEKIVKPTEKQISGIDEPPEGIFIEKERQQRAGLFLKNVKYRIYGYFDFIQPQNRISNISHQPEIWADNNEKEEIVRLDETESKYAAMFERRARKGQCFHRPYLGTREFSCDFRLINIDQEKSIPIDETRDLGFMLYDIEFNHKDSTTTPTFFRASMEKGVIITDRKKIDVII